jgi:hypothetical protein
MKSFLPAILLIISASIASAAGGVFFPSGDYLKSQAPVDESLHPEGLPGGLGAKAFSLCKERIFVKMAMWGMRPEIVKNRANLNVCYAGARLQPSLQKPPAFIQEQFYIRQGDEVVSLNINLDEGKCAEGFVLAGGMPADYFDQYIGNSSCKPLNERGE